MTYLSRPVFEVKPNWLSEPVGEFSYDLRGIRLGFGSSTFAPTAHHVTRGWSMSFTFPTAEEFADVLDFFEPMAGRFGGFWIPCPALQAKVISGTSSTVFEIETQDLENSWSDDASVHFYAVLPDGTTEAFEVSAVSAPSTGVEQITTTSALSGTPDSDWVIYRLLYVQLADDVEQSKAHCEGVYNYDLRVVELPEEYAAAETGQTPAYLYDFWQDNGDSTLYHWRWTSFNSEIVSSGDTFTPFNLTHGSLKQSTRAERSEITISTIWEADSPWALQLPFPSTRPFSVNVYEVDATIPDIRTLVFSGEFSGVEYDGTDVKISFDHWFDSMRRQVPGRTIQPRCHYHLFDSLTCKANPLSYTAPDFQLSVSVSSLTTTDVVLTHANFSAYPLQYPEGFFKEGRLLVGIAPTIEERLIVASSAPIAGQVVVSLSQRIVHQDDPVDGTVWRGCDHFQTTCINTFNNGVNFPGFVDVPRTNPTFKAIEIAGGTSGKK